MLVNIQQSAFRGKRCWFIVFCNFYRVNTATVADSKSPMWMSLPPGGEKRPQWASSSNWPLHPTVYKVGRISVTSWTLDSKEYCATFRDTLLFYHLLKLRVTVTLIIQLLVKEEESPSSISSSSKMPSAESSLPSSLHFLLFAFSLLSSTNQTGCQQWQKKQPLYITYMLLKNKIQLNTF